MSNASLHKYNVFLQVQKRGRKTRPDSNQENRAELPENMTEKRIKSRKPNVSIVSPSSHYKINVWNSKILYTVPIRTTKTTTVIVNVNHEEALELHNNNEESIGHETNETITEENDDLGFDSALVSSFNGSRKGGWKYNLVYK